MVGCIHRCAHAQQQLDDGVGAGNDCIVKRSVAAAMLASPTQNAHNTYQLTRCLQHQDTGLMPAST